MRKDESEIRVHADIRLPNSTKGAARFSFLIRLVNLAINSTYDLTTNELWRIVTYFRTETGYSDSAPSSLHPMEKLNIYPLPGFNLGNPVCEAVNPE